MGGYTWPEVLHLTQSMPNLAVLQLHGNSLSNLGLLPAGALAVLEELDLDDNDLSSWDEVQNLGRLPRLTHLRLNSNQLTELTPLEGSFSSLRSLQVSSNVISTYSALGCLDRLNLTELRMRNNPINRMEKDEETVRQLVVARISSIQYLNGSVVTTEERKWSEIDYLKTHGEEYLALAEIEDVNARATAMEQFMNAHNRYGEIVQKFGEPQKGEGVAVDTSLKSSLMKLKVRCPDSIGSAETVKKVPGSMTVSKLKALLRRVYKTAPATANMELYLVGQTSTSEVRLDNDFRELSFYSAVEGDTVLVRWGAPRETDL